MRAAYLINSLYSEKKIGEEEILRETRRRKK